MSDLARRWTAGSEQVISKGARYQLMPLNRRRGSAQSRVWRPCREVLPQSCRGVCRAAQAHPEVKLWKILRSRMELNFADDQSATGQPRNGQVV